MFDVTQFLSEIEHGDPAATERLPPLLYDELHKRAAVQRAHEMPGRTLQTTAFKIAWATVAILLLAGLSEAAPQMSASNGRRTFQGGTVLDTANSNFVAVVPTVTAFNSIPGSGATYENDSSLPQLFTFNFTADVFSNGAGEPSVEGRYVVDGAPQSPSYFIELGDFNNGTASFPFSTILDPGTHDVHMEFRSSAGFGHYAIGNPSLYVEQTLSLVSADFNADGTVDASDYVVWRKGLGTTYLETDYDLWRTHFGQAAGSAAGSLGNSPVPEPAIAVMLIVGILAIFTRHPVKVSSTHSCNTYRKKYD